MTPPQPATMPISVACLHGNDFGERDARDGKTKDPYRYRIQIAAQNWSDFVDGYLHGFARASHQ